LGSWQILQRVLGQQPRRAEARLEVFEHALQRVMPEAMARLSCREPSAKRHEMFRIHWTFSIRFFSTRNEFWVRRNFLWNLRDLVRENDFFVDRAEGGFLDLKRVDKRGAQRGIPRRPRRHPQGLRNRHMI